MIISNNIIAPKLRIAKYLPLGENVSEVIHQFREDIAGVKETVRDAREAVRSAYKALKEVSGELTPTLTPTP